MKDLMFVRRYSAALPYTHTITIGSTLSGSGTSIAGSVGFSAIEPYEFGNLIPLCIDGDETLIIRELQTTIQRGIRFATFFSLQSQITKEFSPDDPSIVHSGFYFGRSDTKQNFGYISNPNVTDLTSSSSIIKFDGIKMFTEDDVGKTVNIWLSLTNPCPY